MKILMINAQCGTGSTGTIVSDLYQLLVGRGHQVKIGYGHGRARKVPLHDTYKITTRTGYYIHNALAKLTDRAGLFSTFETLKFIKYIKEYDPDIIHLHNLHGYYINYKILFDYLIKSHKNVVWTLHDCWAFTGHCAHFDMVGCVKWKQQCKKCKYISEYPSAYISQAKRNFDLKKRLYADCTNLHIVTVSNWLLGLVRKSILCSHKAETIYNGIDTDVFRPTESDLRERMNLCGRFVMIGVAAPWSERKGLNDYISLKEHLNDKYRIILIGLTNEQIRSLPDGIIGVERTYNQKELAKYYTMANVVMNLSYQETFGLTTVEGMACGTPSIVYDRTASPELVDNRTGVVVKAGNIPEIVKAIETIEHNGSIYYRQNCIARVSKLFNKNNNYLDVLKLYYNLNK